MSAETRAEFESIGAAGRAALNEVRGLLGVLRSDGQLAEHAPQPGVDQIGELLEGSRRAGIPVTWTVSGDQTLVSESVGLVMYRILQESLANTARHASGAAVEVKITYQSPIVSLAVVNGPAKRSLASALTRHESTGGNGIIGMRERAQAVGECSPPGCTTTVDSRCTPSLRPRQPRLTGVAITVFIADDQAMVRQGFGALLSSQPDISVIGDAPDGAVAVTEVKRLRPDVVLMDVRMPEMNGLDAARLILSAGFDPRCVC